MWNFFFVNSFHVELSVTRKQILNFMNYIIDMQHCIQNKIKLCAQSLLSLLFSKHIAQPTLLIRQATSTGIVVYGLQTKK